MSQLNIDKTVSSGNYVDHNFPRVESFTRENIGGYLRYILLNNRKVLTTDSSGDQLLNAVFYGSRDLTLCNDNIVSYYYLQLKIAALLVLDYREFQWFFLKNDMNMHHNNKAFSKRLYKKVGPMLKLVNQDAYYFFEQEFEEYNNREVRNRLLIDSGYHNKAIKNFNMYLRNDNAYTKLRDSLLRINLDYINKDIYKDKVDGKYDVVLLSGLSTKLTLSKFVDLVKYLDANNLNEEAILILVYLWNNNIYTPDYANVWKNIYANPLSNKVINKYVSTVYSLSGYKNYLWEDNKREDKVFIYCKK